MILALVVVLKVDEKLKLQSIIGKNIQRERRRAGYTQEKFSEMIDMETHSLSAIERGVSGISLYALMRACKVLAISSNTLLFEGTPKNDVQSITERLERLTPEQFAIARDVLGKVIEAFALGNRE